MKTASLVEHLSVIKDIRQAWKVEHKLTDILFLTVCAVISGCEGWDEIEDFGEAKLDFLRTYGEFEAGTPSADTIARVISMISPKQFQRVFADWMQECHTVSSGEVIAIDGKTLRGSYDKSRKKGAIHMISAFSAANGVVLGQIKTEEKSNEITAIPELLKLLNLHGCLVTIDAMGCQKKIALEIVNQSADYLLAVKANQPKLADAFTEHFPMSRVATYDGDSYTTQEKSHGRQETRLHIVSDLPDDFHDFTYEWAGLKKLGVVVSFRQEGDEVPDNAMVRYYISSKDLTAVELAEAARQHWFIETKLHWCLDVGMREDACRIRRDMASENLAGIRHIAMNYLKSEKTFKGGIKRKQKKAAMMESYLAKVLAA